MGYYSCGCEYGTEHTCKEVWGTDEVIEHLQKVCMYFGVEMHGMTNAHQLLKMLEEYDEVHPITQEQADVVSAFVIDAIERVQVRKAAEAIHTKKVASQYN